MSEEISVTLTKSEGVGYITFNRAPANAYTLAFHQEFNACIDQANVDGEIKVVVIRSAVEKFFCAGADIKVFLANSTEENKLMVESARNALAKMEASSKIFIAELNGHALGGGLEIAMACDLRFAGDKKFLLGLPEVKLGLLPGNGGSQRLARLVGGSRAVQILVSGENINAKEAYHIGLVTKHISSDQLKQETSTFAQELAKGASLAIAAVKKSVNEGLEMNLSDGLELEANLVDELYNTKDAEEGFAAFVEKRDPVYRGE